MVSRPTSRAAQAAARDIGQQLLTWRKLLDLTADQVAQRAGLARGTVRRVEHGEPGVSFAAVLDVARSLGVLKAIVEATDPYNTDLGRARADQALPRRVRP
ncbi:MAG: helix-turn-helix domain-containing protein [Bifidobacteriaceae bacterium]|jgi:transcriptional regulator with XRE-family HTH domain|nr:helix-turn-helix domain-containing protein [Bifidobacteriaceae bacterium]